MPIDLTPKLTHLGQWITTTNTADAYGGFTSATSTTTLACFAYLETREKFLSPAIMTLGKAWKIIVEKARHDIKVDHLFTQIFDDQGVLVHVGGRVVEMIVYRHYLHGPQFVELTLADN